MAASAASNRILTPTRKIFRTYGDELMQSLAHAFDDARIVPHDGGEYKRVDLWSGFNVRLCPWGGKPYSYYITLYLKARYLFELDLSRIVETKGRFTWYLNRPSDPKNRQFLSELLPWVEEIPGEYLGRVRLTKVRLSAGRNLPKSGYRLCEQSAGRAMEARFVEVVRQAIAKHLPSQKESAGADYGLDDKEAFEGYEQDRVVTARARNRLLVEQCRKRDNNTCQACGFHLFVGGQHVIECHHINPLSKSGVRLVSVDELICLCPTCHRLAHKRSNPFSIAELKVLLTG